MRTGHLEVRIAASPSSRDALATGASTGDAATGPTHTGVASDASAVSAARGRVGIVVPKYRRLVVERNRVRRRLRELVRTRLLPVMPACDVLIRALPHAYEASVPTLAREIDVIAARLG